MGTLGTMTIAAMIEKLCFGLIRFFSLRKIMNASSGLGCFRVVASRRLHSVTHRLRGEQHGMGPYSYQQNSASVVGGLLCANPPYAERPDNVRSALSHPEP